MTNNDSGNWQKKWNSEYPLFCSFIINLGSGVIILILGMLWATKNIPPDPKITQNKIAPSISEITITNEGLIPANAFYSASSAASTTLQIDNIKEGEQYIQIEPTNDTEKSFIIRSLPRGKIIKFDIMGSKEPLIIKQSDMVSESDINWKMLNSQKIAD